jgi:hypothetical protein
MRPGSPLRRLTRYLGLVVATVVVATALPAAPAQAAWSAPTTVNVDVFSEYHVLATLDGTVRFDSGDRKASYSLTTCRESSFQAPYLKLYVNTLFRSNIHLSWSGTCSTFSATYTHGTTLRNIQFVLVGSTFDNNVYEELQSTGGGPNHGSSYGRYDNPYN